MSRYNLRKRKNRKKEIKLLKDFYVNVHKFQSFATKRATNNKLTD